MMLPDFDGMEVLRRLRADAEDVPVLFLTARDAVEDRVAGLTAGGDDYVTKPFSLEEVVARLRALMRRAGAQQATDHSVLTVGDLVLDEDSHEVTRGGAAITLTATEFELLRYLMRNPQTGAVEGADPRPGLELRLRRAGERRGALHLLPAQEDRRRPRADDPHDARRRLRAQAGRADVAAYPHLAHVPAGADRRRAGRAGRRAGLGGHHRGDEQLPHRQAGPRRAWLRRANGRRVQPRPGAPSAPGRGGAWPSGPGKRSPDRAGAAPSERPHLGRVDGHPRRHP